MTGVQRLAVRALLTVNPVRAGFNAGNKSASKTQDDTF